MNKFDQRIWSKCDKCKAFLKKLLHVYFPETNKKTQATGQPHQAIKDFIRRRNFHNIRRKLYKKRSVDCVKKTLFYNYLKSRDIYDAEFACLYNLWTAKDQLHMYAFNETWAFLMHSYVYMY